MPERVKKIRTRAIQSTKSTPIVPKSSPLCKSHIVRKSETLPSLPAAGGRVICVKLLYGGRERYKCERLVIMILSPLAVISHSFSLGLQGRGSLLQLLSFCNWYNSYWPRAKTEPAGVLTSPRICLKSAPSGKPLLKSSKKEVVLSVTHIPLFPYSRTRLFQAILPLNKPLFHCWYW